MADKDPKEMGLGKIVGEIVDSVIEGLQYQNLTVIDENYHKRVNRREQLYKELDRREKEYKSNK
jgi:hypothetical protein